MKNVTIADLKVNIYFELESIMYVLIAWMVGHNAIKKMFYYNTLRTFRSFDLWRKENR